MVYLVKSTSPKKGDLSNPLYKQLYGHILMDARFFPFLSQFTFKQKKRKSYTLTEAEVLGGDAHNPWETWFTQCRDVQWNQILSQIPGSNSSFNRKNKAQEVTLISL